MHAAALSYVKVVEALCDPLHRKGLCEDIDANVRDTEKGPRCIWPPSAT